MQAGTNRLTCEMGMGYGPGRFSCSLTGSGEAQVFPVTSTVTRPVLKKAFALPAMSFTITESLYRPHISGSRVEAPVWSETQAKISR